MACFVQLNQLFFYFSFTVFYCFAPSVHSFAHIQAVFFVQLNTLLQISFFLYNLTDCFLFFCGHITGSRQQAVARPLTDGGHHTLGITFFCTALFISFLFIFLYSFIYCFYISFYFLLQAAQAGRRSRWGTYFCNGSALSALLAGSRLNLCLLATLSSSENLLAKLDSVSARGATSKTGMEPDFSIDRQNRLYITSAENVKNSRKKQSKETPKNSYTQSA